MQAIFTICFALGIKKAIKSIIAQPALVLTPIFSFWTFGPVKSDDGCAYRRSESKICLSFRLTWFNAILSFCGTYAMVTLYESYIRNKGTGYWDRDGTDGTEMLLYFHGTYLPLFALAIICLLLIQFMDKCSSCCCRCYKENCYPMTEKIIFDTEMPSV